jgi:anti-anti-sigma regulatory factor
VDTAGHGAFAWLTFTLDSAAEDSIVLDFASVKLVDAFGNSLAVNPVPATIYITNPNSAVWPGETNNDYTVDHFDPLNIALAYGDSGNVRPGATINWGAEPCYDWSTSFAASMLNKKNADCDGNGVIDSLDLVAVTANYGLSYTPLTAFSASPQSVGADLFFSPAQTTYTAGSIVTIPVHLGTAAAPATGVYGVATQITHDHTRIVPGSLSVIYSGSWMAPVNNRLHFEYDAFAQSRFDFATARISHNDTTGYGVIAWLTFTIDSSATDSIVLDFANVRIVDDSGMTVPFNAAPVTIYISTILQAESADAAASLSAYPVPADEEINLVYTLTEQAPVQITVTGADGRIVYADSQQALQGTNTTVIPAAGLAGGIYTVTISSGNRVQQCRFTVVH